MTQYMENTRNRSEPRIQQRTSSARLTPLDEERQASMADEGGFSGALMDIDDVDERRRLQLTPRRQRRVLLWAGAVVAVLGIAFYAVSRQRR